MRVRFVGEGPRDEAVLPPLTRNVLNREVEPFFRSWRSIHLNAERGRKGLDAHGRKLLWLIELASEEGLSGLVAVRDHDKGDEDRLGPLQEARQRYRESGGSLAVALGCPKPHIEAWLLDDAAAVRGAFGLPAETEVPSPTKVSSPKEALSSLFDSCSVKDAGRKELEVLPDLAARVSASRCPHREQTGFQAFVQDVTEAFAAAT